MSAWYRLGPGAFAWILAAWLSPAVLACAQGSTTSGLTGGSGGAGAAAPAGGGGKGGNGDGGGCGALEQVAGDCKIKVCQSGAVTEATDNTDVPDDGKLCTVDSCSGGEPAWNPVAAGAACSDDGGKVCDGDGQCVACLVPSDCAPGEACSPSHTCVPASCADGVKNGDETDVDCGGGCGATCQPGDICLDTGDCALGTCEANVCVYDPCADGLKNGDETDVDCGGSCAQGANAHKCGPDEGCAVDADCVGSDCNGATCLPNCADQAQNNGETGVDCGGPCPMCVVGNACAGAADCAGGPCVDGVCCDSPCLGTCKACSAAKKGSGMNGVCGDVAPGSDPDNECAGALSCGLGQCQIANGQPCAQNAECQSGFCADDVCCNTACGGACQACSAVKKGSGTNGTCGSIAAGSDPDSECFGATTCNGVGACALLSNGSSCNANAECQSAFCADGVCCNTACDTECQACTTAKKGSGANGTCGAVAVGSDPDSECAGALVCAMGGCKLPNGEACISPATCVAGFCVDGVCCSAACTGPCVSCLAAKKGSGVDGACGNIALGTDPDGECGGMASCSGAGTCALFADGVACAAGVECTSGNCVDGVCCNTTCTTNCQACTAAKKGGGVDGTCGPIGVGLDPDNECAGAAACNGVSACLLLANGTACAMGSECASSYCVDGVCCNSSCTAVCQACTLAKKGTGTDGTCGSITIGADPDSECGGAASCSGGASCALFANGAACAANNECGSGYCADGVCCNSACTATCQACTAAKKGSGTDGSCASIASGADPDNECTGAQVCNGSGACKIPNGQACSAAVDCLSGYCVDGVCCSSSCTTACQACTLVKKGSGADGTCGNIASGTDPDSECGGAASCSGAGACALFINGTACAVNAECQSNYCVDGVCCSSACNTSCQACTAAKKGSGNDGLCGSIVSGADPDDECTGVQVCNGGGACKVPNGQACSAGADCISTYCVDGVCCGASCTGVCQACTLTKKGSGADGTCGNIAVSTDPDSECFGALSCNGSGACALLANGLACTNNAECLSAYCIDGYCCSSACNSLCQACSAVKKNSGANGTCGNIASGTDPDSECPGATLCSGSATCSLFSNGVACTQNGECLSGSCVDGVCCNAPCNGLCQACIGAKTGVSNGTCSGVVTGTDPDNECDDLTSSPNCAGALMCGP
jgi:hypothetical protein